MENNGTQYESKNESSIKEEIIREHKQNRKIDLSIIVSIIALLITILQFVFSSPFFIEFYYDSSFEIKETNPILNGNSLLSNFLLKNNSKNTVNNIEISIQLLSSDKITILPQRDLKLTFKEDPLIKDCFLIIDKLVPNETVLIIVHSNYDSLIYYNKLFLDDSIQLQNEFESQKQFKKGINSEYLLFPNITLAKHEKGFGEITRLPKDILLSYKQYKIDSIKNKE